MGYVLRVCLTIGPIAKRKKMPALGYFKDTHKTQNSSAYEKFECGHLGSWYIKSTH